MKLVVVALLAAFALEGEAFDIDRSVMSDKYWSIWNDEVQAKIDADIEKYRKEDATFEVAAPDGTEVRIEQVGHAFYFGAQIFNFNQLGKKEWNDRYKELYGTLFNSATVAFYWRTLEVYPYAPRFEERYEDTENFWNSCPHPKDQPHWRRPAVDPVISFLKTRGCRIHGHPLVWGSSAWHTPTWLWDDFCPESEKLALEQASGVKVPRRDFTVPMGVKDMKSDPKGRLWAAAWEEIYKRLSDEEISKLVPTFLKAQNDFYERRIRDIGERYGSRVDSWDVVNESATDYDRFGRKAVRGKPFDRSGYGIMPSDYACKAFTWCQKYLPSTALLNINECNMEPFFEQVDDLIAHGARIDVVGSQMHLFNPAESVNIARGEGPAHLRPEAVAERFRVLSQANRPIHLSEITITAPDNSLRGQMVQAIIMRNLYRAWFSVEKMNGITWWNVVDDCGAPGEPSISGLFTRDMRPKAAYFAMDDLVNREWKTKTTAKASGGKVSFRGFKGRYRLSWKGADGKSHEAYVQVADNHSAVDKGREITLHDGWEFSRDKKYWKGVRVPHDWAISGPFDQKLGGKTGMLPWKGVGYYRRTLELPPEAAGKYVALRFGGVMANPEVFLNGEKAGGWDYGYMSFEVDVSDKIKFGEKNEILVKADTTKHMSRWYPGAGIYRDVKLVVEDAKDRAIWGSVKITTPEVAPERAKVRVEYRTPARETPVVNEFEVERPILWDVTNPKLYETTICGKKYRYGIRTAKFTANDGFHLNGRRVQLKGVNLHSDLGPLGMAFDRGAMRRQLEIMKDMGVNALRTSHNAPAEEVLDLCDEMGIVVWDECFDKWEGTAGLAPNEPPEELVSRNLRQFVRRDRNHPCVVAWSIGNEIPPRSKDKPAGVFEERCKLFRDAVLSEDATRPVGIGCCFTNSVGRGDYAAMDLTGWNYNELYMPMRDKYPEKPVVYTESASAFSSWGYFPDAPTTNPTNYDPKTVVDVDSYDRCSARWSDIPDMEFARMERDRFVAGEFVWTGIDYLGEPTPNPTLCRSSFFGICDLCAMPKDRYWLYRSHWNDREETVHLLPHWNWEGHEGEKVMVMCYTSGDEAELFVNGRSAGRRKKTRDAGCIVGKGDPSYYKVTERYRLVWEVPYEPGEIKVVAFRDGRSIGEDSRKTAHKAAAVKLTPEQNELADDELGFVKVELVDEKGTVLPLANDRVNFKLEGPGEIVAVGNGSHNGLDSFAETSSHPLYFGRALVIVRRTGGSDLPIKLTASIPSARSATVALNRKNLDVAVDFSTTVGPVKPVNGVGQPPILGINGMSMFHYLKEAGIPYSRLHDVGGAFGKNIYVDIPNLFRDFDADENDPASYDFTFTDLLMKALVDNGVEPYFRLGVTIENSHHVKAYRIFPPKDYAKWARICEHVVRHYTEGWADGFKMNVSHWEIWNEPENYETIEKNAMWKAPFSEYVRLYVVASKHLKECFPHLKIGGYASCGFYGVSSCWAKPDKDPRIPFLHESFTNFLAGVRDAKAPLDFFSFHCYDRPVHAVQQIAYCRRTLDDFGFAKAEMSLNEWIPCAGCPRRDEDATPRQTAETAAMLCAMQNGPVDDAEIYDARCGVGGYSPLFDCKTYKPKPAYYVFLAFNELRKLGRAASVSGMPEGVWATAATDGDVCGALLVANATDAKVLLSLSSPGWRAVSSRIVEEGRNNVETDVPASLAPYGVALVRFVKQPQSIDR